MQTICGMFFLSHRHESLGCDVWGKEECVCAFASEQEHNVGNKNNTHTIEQMGKNLYFE